MQYSLYDDGIVTGSGGAPSGYIRLKLRDSGIDLYLLYMATVGNVPHTLPPLSPKHATPVFPTLLPHEGQFGWVQVIMGCVP